MRAQPLSILLLLAGMLSPLDFARSSAIVVDAQLSPPAPGLGESAQLELVRAPADSASVPRGIGVVLRPTTDALRFEVTPVRVGRVGIAVGKPSAADTLWWYVEPRLQAAHPDSLRPIASIGSIRPDWLPTLALGVIVLAPLLILLWRLLRRRRAVSTPFELPAEPAHHAALRRLQQIEDSGWLSNGEHERFYVEASHALRSYVGERFRVPALDWTSTEVVAGLLDAGHPTVTVRAVGPLLGAADGVKFAAARPTEHQAQQWLQDVRAWIQESAVEAVYTTAESVVAAQRFNQGR